MLSFDSVRHPARNPVENLVDEVNRFLDGLPGGYHLHIHRAAPVPAGYWQSDTRPSTPCLGWFSACELPVGTLPGSGPWLAADELVRPTEEDLRGQVPALFTAEGALDRDGLKWEFLDAG